MTDLNAEDVVATFEFMLRNMDTLGLASAVWSNLESVELIDEYTCKITLSQYFATFENSLTYTWILSDEDIEQYGDDFQSAERVIKRALEVCGVAGRPVCPLYPQPELLGS